MPSISDIISGCRVVFVGLLRLQLYMHPQKLNPAFIYRLFMVNLWEFPYGHWILIGSPERFEFVWSFTPRVVSNTEESSRELPSVRSSKPQSKMPNARLHHRGSKLDPRPDLRSTQICCTIRVQSWTGDRDEAFSVKVRRKSVAYARFQLREHRFSGRGRRAPLRAVHDKRFPINVGGGGGGEIRIAPQVAAKSRVGCKHQHFPYRDRVHVSAINSFEITDECSLTLHATEQLLTNGGVVYGLEASRHRAVTDEWWWWCTDVLAEEQFNVETLRLVVRSQRDRSTSHLAYGSRRAVPSAQTQAFSETNRQHLQSEQKTDYGGDRRRHLRENSPTSGIVRHDSLMRKFVSEPAKNLIQFANVGGFDAPLFEAFELSVFTILHGRGKLLLSQRKTECARRKIIQNINRGRNGQEKEFTTKHFVRKETRGHSLHKKKSTPMESSLHAWPYGAQPREALSSHPDLGHPTILLVLSDVLSSQTSHSRRIPHETRPVFYENERVVRRQLSQEYPRPLLTSSARVVTRAVTTETLHALRVEARVTVARIAPSLLDLGRAATYMLASRVQFPAGSPDFRKWESCQTMPLVGGFSRVAPVTPALLFWRCSMLTSANLVGSQERAGSLYRGRTIAWPYCVGREARRAGSSEVLQTAITAEGGDARTDTRHVTSVPPAHSAWHITHCQQPASTRDTRHGRVPLYLRPSYDRISITRVTCFFRQTQPRLHHAWAYRSSKAKFGQRSLDHPQVHVLNYAPFLYIDRRHITSGRKWQYDTPARHAISRELCGTSTQHLPLDDKHACLEVYAHAHATKTLARLETLAFDFTFAFRHDSLARKGDGTLDVRGSADLIAFVRLCLKRGNSYRTMKSCITMNYAKIVDKVAAFYVVPTPALQETRSQQHPVKARKEKQLYSHGNRTIDLRTMTNLPEEPVWTKSWNYSIGCSRRCILSYDKSAHAAVVTDLRYPADRHRVRADVQVNPAHDISRTLLQLFHAQRWCARMPNYVKFGQFVHTGIRHERFPKTVGIRIQNGRTRNKNTRPSEYGSSWLPLALRDELWNGEEMMKTERERDGENETKREKTRRRERKRDEEGEKEARREKKRRGGRKRGEEGRKVKQFVNGDTERTTWTPHVMEVCWPSSERADMPPRTTQARHAAAPVTTGRWPTCGEVGCSEPTPVEDLLMHTVYSSTMCKIDTDVGLNTLFMGRSSTTVKLSDTKNLFNVGAQRMVVHSRRDRATSSLVYGTYQASNIAIYRRDVKYCSARLAFFRQVIIMRGEPLAQPLLATVTTELNNPTPLRAAANSLKKVAVLWAEGGGSIVGRSAHVHRSLLPRRPRSISSGEATVAERLASHQGDPGSIPGRATPDFRMWESCRTIPLVGGFSRGSHVSPVPSFRRCPILASITLIGSQDLYVKRRPNPSTPISSSVDKNRV
ncbi:hypothetical protein PR048_003388 [Dryococelus australis]|uniref:Uncharacterized protein n=1 Tax=Dryococelus australis TaxID=614101 RepID=A0ABQ9IPY0_9NEOP|nr:hypothetical protein PR048_003388 [Dryococelus australis]